MQNLRHFLIQSIPENFETERLIEMMDGFPFILSHDLLSGTTSVISESADPEKFSRIGVCVKEPITYFFPNERFVYIEMVPKEEPKHYGYEEKGEDDKIYQLFRTNARVFTTFFPPQPYYLNSIKAQIEDRISRISVRSTKSLPSFSSSSKDSVHSDLYFDSGSKKLLASLLENVNESILSKGVSYKVGMLIEETGSQQMISYLKSKATVLGETRIRAKDMAFIYHILKNADGIPIPYRNAAKLAWISNRTKKVKSFSTSKPASEGQIIIGNYLEAGINETEHKVSIQKSVFNLGTLITGVPGTGKTMASKHILSQLRPMMRHGTVIISPTEEWNGFGKEMKMRRIDLSDPSIRMNLFRCESRSAQKFYEDLAMLISSASNAGPYKNAIEKCLLSAFAKAYSKGNDPEPEEVYMQIEDAIAEQHAKRTPNSIKYTKHGENIKSSLENIRIILMKPQFAYCGGISFRDLIKTGVVFDLSNVSNIMKPLFYAFILNQVYSITDEFDISGDNDARALICVEEAHLIFGGEEESAATTDLKQRIQNFRKKGIALMLITHNVTDINPGIRRLCQIKMYFRQSPDIAKFAANDMIFLEDDYLKGAEMFKTLGQRVCALNFIEVLNGSKVPASSMFAKVCEYHEKPYIHMERKLQLKGPDTIVLIETNPNASQFELYYLNEKILTGNLEQRVAIKDLLYGKKYKFVILGQRRKENKEFMILGGNQNSIN